MSLATSLIDLKAELLKKREESKSDRDPQVNVKGGQKWKLLADKIDVKNKVKQLKARKERTSDEDERKIIDEEIEKQLRLSREALERKAAIYEARMGKAMEGIFQDSDEESEDEDKRCLINFDGKALEQIKIRNEERRQAESRLRGYKRKEDEEDSEDWVEFTDSLGRTRRCLRKDLKFFVDADKHLEKDEKLEPQSSGLKKFKLIDSDEDDEDNYREEEKSNEQGPVHYTDVRYNEVRDHGVGFYKLSGESEERTKQLDQLNQLREQTIEQIKVKAKEKEKKSIAIEQRLARIAARRGIKFKSKSSTNSNEQNTNNDDH
ncbi:coiled-coil domain-containing protein 174-like [Panonychus citri]|uniref:coiled-coil domain-containing protein 174-like n=1 Tax=Panonychus citri TaxID=50023 RepID=UPI00230765F8|nr:coiled-coil domain-containing protein 174-like [Panonychus citri]XP_053202783.1 coiled-coil domain-containing protein 174-like [Panonychus citri]XP_053202784.1 coiled-coil domain-containing protein 174-like [Panonychus citri]XP_053202785.1 coiled-coil domain-containing protein 174-like [Panonychus citri]XP_053202786.1 coiled-coil domain-containing protein 174-like [Panonychus citri]XP_053202787.1 coiled-coil domain-containing protein 174-like [Panonychus citri]XP_053202788.1 coiled-coil do